MKKEKATLYTTQQTEIPAAKGCSTMLSFGQRFLLLVGKATDPCLLLLLLFLAVRFDR